MYKADSCNALQPSITRPHNAGYVTNTSVAVCNPFIVFASSSSGQTSGQNLEVLNIINTDTKTYKNIRKSQSMIKKLSASHQEIKIEADAHFEIKNWTLFHT